MHIAIQNKETIKGGQSNLAKGDIMQKKSCWWAPIFYQIRGTGSTSLEVGTTILEEGQIVGDRRL